MTLTASRPRVTFDPLRDKSYEQTVLGRDVVDFLAWKRLGGMADRSLLDYEWALKFLCLAYPELRLADVTDAHAAHVLARFPARSRRERVVVFGQFFKWARLTRRIESNPMELLPTVKRPGQRVIDVFTGAEREALCGLPLRDGALMRLLLAGGLRKGEARAICYRDVRPEPMPGQLVILGGKGDKDRLVPIGERTAAMVAELAFLDGLEPRDHLWYDRPGGHRVRRRFFDREGRETGMSETSFHRWWNRCVAEAGVRYRNPHVTRHTFATKWLRRGGRLTTLSRAMGHASIRTTFDLYGHLDTRDVETDLALIESEDG